MVNIGHFLCLLPFYKFPYFRMQSLLSAQSRIALTVGTFCYSYVWFYILHNFRVMLIPYDLQALSRLLSVFDINYLQKCTILNCIVTILFNHNCSVRELAPFGSPLKNSKSKRLLVALNSLGFKRLCDLGSMYTNFTLQN